MKRSSKMKSSIALFSVLMLGIGAGCAKTVNSVEISQEGSWGWVKTDPDLGGTAAVQRVNQTRAGDVMALEVVVANQNSNAGEFIYRFIWLDANGMTIPTPLTNWQRQHILGKQTVAIRGVAPDARATKCRL
jgi:uncharacterized protein YcfL